jgi:hypothetical protein
MKLQDAIYHGIHDQIRRVLNIMGDERIDRGLSAFEDGASNWRECFFARAYSDYNLERDAEKRLMKAMGLNTPIPIRIVYQAFDGANSWMSKAALYKFISDIRDESRPNEVLNVLKGMDFSTVESVSLDTQLCSISGDSIS